MRKFNFNWTAGMAELNRRELLEAIKRLPRSEDQAYYLHLLGDSDALLLEEVLDIIEPRAEPIIEVLDWSSFIRKPCGTCANCRARQRELN